MIQDNKNGLQGYTGIFFLLKLSNNAVRKLVKNFQQSNKNYI